MLGRDDVRYRVRSARARLVARNPAQGSWSASLPTGRGLGTAAADGHLADTRTAQGGLCRRRLLFPRPREDASRPQREARVFGAVSETSKQRELVAELGARRFDLVEPGAQLLRLSVEASQFTPEAIPLRGGGAL